jgi:hypothetical protein
MQSLKKGITNSKEITYLFYYTILKIIITQQKGAITHAANSPMANRVFPAAKFMSTGAMNRSRSRQKSEEIVSM